MALALVVGCSSPRSLGVHVGHDDAAAGETPDIDASRGDAFTGDRPAPLVDGSTPLPDGGTCPMGRHPCNSACVDDRSPATCGTSCEACPTIKGGTATCDGTKCGGTCPMGQTLCRGECLAAGMACGGACPAGFHDCGGVCADNKSVNSCGPTACTPCPTPNGSKATCDGSKCDFTCTTGKRCGNECVDGCCVDMDCPAQAGRVVKCDTATRMCSAACATGTKPCGGTCIPMAACCADADCPNNFACVMGACSTTTCRAGFKTCNGACIASSACCPSPENCFNGMDDNCDGKVDCADPTCAPAALCVPAAAPGFGLVVKVKATDPCPAGYTAKMTSLQRGPASGSSSCSGCKCTPMPASCRPELFVYVGLGGQGTPLCDADTTNAGGMAVNNEPSSATCIDPDMLGTGGFTQGFRLASWEIVGGGCTSDASAARPPVITWADSAKFCEVSMTGGGCAGGSVCVPVVASQPKRCGLVSGAMSCSGTYNQSEDWLTGVTDNRVCSCSCNAKAANCNAAHVHFGSDWLCEAGSTADYNISTAGTKVCRNVYSPPAQVIGTANNPCPPTSTVSADLLPQGRHTLCCAP
jgi:hypothetical protein